MSVQYTITIGKETLPVLVRRRAGTRRMVIRYQPLHHALSLTLPRYVSIRQGLHFIEQKRPWIERQLHAKQQRIPFIDGQAIPVLGRDYTLKHTGGRGVVRIEGEQIIVPGDAAFMKRRVREWLKKLVLTEIEQLARDKARQIGHKAGKISVRDTSSRWGSCSHDGNLSFSWRLVFAPHEVLDYLVAHEVAHLAQHNHSPAFWAIVRRLCPENERPKRWLKAHGEKLYAYG